MMSLLKVSWRSVWRNKRRTFITVGAISFALAVAVFFIAFAEGMYRQLINDAVRMQAGHFTFEHEEYRDAPAVDLVVGDVARLREGLESIDGVEATKVLVLGQGVARSGNGTSGAALIGVEAAAEVKSSVLAKKIVAGEYLAKGDDRKAVIGESLARRLKLKVGKKFVVSSNNKDGDLSEELVRVKGIFKTGAEEIDGYLVQVPIDFSRRLYGLGPEEATQVGVVLTDPEAREAAMAAASTVSGRGGAAMLPWEEVLPDLAAYIKLDGGSNLVFQGILIFLSLFTIFNTILMSVLERKREFAVLLALGTPERRLRAQILTESGILGFLGCLVGLVVGGLPAYRFELVGWDISSWFEEGMTVSGLAVDTTVFFHLSAELLIGLGGLVFAATMLTALFTVRRISAIKVADVLR